MSRHSLSLAMPFSNHRTCMLTPFLSLLVLLPLLGSIVDASLQDRAVVSLAAPSPSTAVSDSRSPEPTVDLGYALYKPTAVNFTGQYYNFSNIRYAAPPLGDLRWRAPANPLADRSNVNDGALGYVCPQAQPQWFIDANKALGDLANVIPPAISGQTQSEDCLFLDVIAPVKHFQKGSQPAQVLVNIHGGGFWIGDKTTLYPPNGLLAAANNDFIYVSMNYRLNALGFLTGQKHSKVNQTTPNAGLLDQRFALKWVQQYIHLFGGDPTKVTITGESAGGGSVQYHTISYGGAKEANLFYHGIAQSPAPLASDPKYAPIGANLFLTEVGVATIDEARKAPTEVLQKACLTAQNSTPFDVVYFGPVVDHDLILDIIPRAYNRGKFVKNVTMIAANNQNEARFLGNQSIRTNADFDNWVHATFPSAPPRTQNRIINELYPPNYSGKYPYRTPQERSDLAVKEYTISCNTVSIATAYKNQSHNYIFNVSPAIHAQDLAYTYTPNAPTPDYYPQIATDLQTYLAKFALTGNPNPDPNVLKLPNWPVYGPDARAIEFTASGVQQIRSDAANERCEFWNQATYFPSRGVARSHS